MEHATKRQGRYLPFWTVDGAVYHVVFRLADSLPRSVTERLRQERVILSEQATLDMAERSRLARLQSDELESILDAGHGSCVLSMPEIGDLMVQVIKHHSPSRYRLHAWCVMPNHIHLLLEPTRGHSLDRILHSIKSYSSNEINRRLMRVGQLWTSESYNHIIRDDGELEVVKQYIRNNPAKTGLKNWRWVSGSD